jgi:glucan phosphoethanolaminetransferase (alkaline phosphatase superfamily)
MAEKVPQTFANHTRFDPIYHFFMVPLAFILLIWSIVRLVRNPGLAAIPWFIASLLIFLTIFIARTYALKAQDRVIRLEETMRLAKLSPNGSIPALTEGQLIALRFASDAELPALAEKAAAANLKPKEIKQAIQTWRPDYFRV